MLNGNGSVLRLTLFDTGSSERKRSEEHTSELQSRLHLVCRLLLEKKKTSDHAQAAPVMNLFVHSNIPNSHVQQGIAGHISAAFRVVQAGGLRGIFSASGCGMSAC